jgi:hypothetical protein
VIRVAVERAPRRTRAVTFEHGSHEDLRCRECHATPVTLATSPEVASCTACHDQHHDQTGNCAACHRPAFDEKVHTREAHVECSACHEPQTISRLTPTRAFCLGCHAPEVDHYRDRECTVCHMLAPPEAVRAQLSRKR